MQRLEGLRSQNRFASTHACMALVEFICRHGSSQGNCAFKVQKLQGPWTRLAHFRVLFFIIIDRPPPPSLSCVLIILWHVKEDPVI